MKAILHLVLSFTVSFLMFTSCGRNEIRNPHLVMLDSLVDESPHSALALISCTDVSSLSRGERMYLELLRAKAMNKADSLFTTDSILLQVADYYDSHGTPNQQMLAHYLLGRAYSDMGSAPRAIEAFHDAEDRADTTSTDCDYGILMRIHSQLAQTYSSLALYDEENKECEKAHRCCMHAGDTLMANLFRERMLRVIYIRGDYEECIRKADELREYYLRNNQIDKSFAISLYHAKCYLNMQKSDSAYKHLCIFSAVSPEHMRNLAGGCSSKHYYFAEYYQGKGMLDSAIICYKAALSNKLEPNHLSSIYKGLSSCYRKCGNVDSTLLYESLYSEAVDSAYDAEILEKSINMASQFNYNIERKVADSKTLEALRFRTMFLWCLLAITLLALVVIVVMYRNALARKRLADMYVSHQSAVDSLRMSENEISSLLSQRSELEARCLMEKSQADELKRQMSSINDEMAKKSLLAEELMTKIRSYESLISKESATDRNVLFCHSEIVSRFRQTFTASGYTIKSKDWAQLNSTAEEIFPGFIARIDKDNNLSETEKRVCLLVKAGFSPSDIEYLLQMKHSFASNTRKRLHEKVFGVTGSASEFDAKIRFVQ